MADCSWQLLFISTHTLRNRCIDLDPAVVVPKDSEVMSKGESLTATCNALSSLNTSTVWFKVWIDAILQQTAMLRKPKSQTSCLSILDTRDMNDPHSFYQLKRGAVCNTPIRLVFVTWLYPGAALTFLIWLFQNNLYIFVFSFKHRITERLVEVTHCSWRMPHLTRQENMSVTSQYHLCQTWRRLALFTSLSKVILSPWTDVTWRYNVNKQYQAQISRTHTLVPSA